MKSPVFITLLLLIANSAYSYNWPIAGGNNNKIDAALGEYRTGHLHNGVDINKGGTSGDEDIGTTVTAINDGQFSRNRIGEDVEYAKIVSENGTEFDYVHIETLNIKQNSEIKIGQKIGYLKKLNTAGWASHVHIIERDDNRELWGTVVT